ncbi:hypothetical protein B296_00044963 [Ensete ventricosum]|uniref:Uncharacterized protein n=1 Tax=Ensete ventricosum TaxID=4639 RepID=A0A426Z923_ENSVE|nr:hypothetical protein B296_00044963 [Ensete ventricosum]
MLHKRKVLESKSKTHLGAGANLGSASVRTPPREELESRRKKPAAVTSSHLSPTLRTIRNASVSRLAHSPASKLGPAPTAQSASHDPDPSNADGGRHKNTFPEPSNPSPASGFRDFRAQIAPFHQRGKMRAIVMGKLRQVRRKWNFSKRADASNATNVWKATVGGRRRQIDLEARLVRCFYQFKETVQWHIFGLSTWILSANLRVTMADCSCHVLVGLMDTGRVEIRMEAFNRISFSLV